MGVTVSHYNLIFKNWLWAGFGLQAIVCRSQMDCITLRALAVVKRSISIIAGWERAGEEACVCESWDDTLQLQMGTSFSIHPTGSPLHLERSLMLMSILVERKTPATLSHNSPSIAAKLLAWRQELHLAMVASWTQRLGRDLLDHTKKKATAGEGCGGGGNSLGAGRCPITMTWFPVPGSRGNFLIFLWWKILIISSFCSWTSLTHPQKHLYTWLSFWPFWLSLILGLSSSLPFMDPFSLSRISSKELLAAVPFMSPCHSPLSFQLPLTQVS